MKTVEFIRMGLEASSRMTLALLEDMKDTPLAFPTAKGGNHPLWIMGHIAYSEGFLIHELMLGGENPLAHWKEIYSFGTEPTADPSRYPDFDSALKAFRDVRAKTMRVLEGLTDADLDLPTKKCPPDLKEVFGTYGQCLLMSILHPVNHRGQVADARRAVGRKPLRR
jgi:uncharacterized damage-inducible protein DinB